MGTQKSCCSGDSYFHYFASLTTNGKYFCTLKTYYLADLNRSTPVIESITSHKHMYAVLKLRGPAFQYLLNRESLETRTVASRFCQPEFTIADLRNVYNSVWNTKLDLGNFKRKVKQSEGFLTPTPDKTPSTEKGGRPAVLWTAGPADKLDPPIQRPEK